MMLSECTPSDTVLRFEHKHIDSCRGKHPRGAQPRETSADDHDIARTGSFQSLHRLRVHQLEQSHMGDRKGPFLEVHLVRGRHSIIDSGLWSHFPPVDRHSAR
jgi:hypothetical protein